MIWAPLWFDHICNIPLLSWLSHVVELNTRISYDVFRRSVFSDHMPSLTMDFSLPHCGVGCSVICCENLACDIVRIYRQNTSARGITNTFYFSMQTHLIGKIFSCYTLLLCREPSKL